MHKVYIIKNYAIIEPVFLHLIEATTFFFQYIPDFIVNRTTKRLRYYFKKEKKKLKKIYRLIILIFFYLLGKQ